MIGGTHSHAEGKADVLRTSSDFHVLGMWEPDREVLQRFTGRGWHSLDLDAILKDPAIEAVAVESAVKDNAKLAVRCLEAGKHVHLEKPPATSMQEFRRVVEVARSNRRVLQVGYMWRYNPGVTYMLDAAKAGALGDIYMFSAVIDTLIEDRRRPTWALFRGGHMFELGSHVIEVMVRLLGRPSQVTPFLRHHGRQSDGLNDNTLAVFQFEKALGVVHGATLQPQAGPHRRMEVRGSNGVLTMQPLEPPRVETHFLAANGVYPAGRQWVKLPSYSRYVDDFRDFAAAIRTGTALPVTHEHELLVHDTLLRASGMS